MGCKGYNKKSSCWLQPQLNQDLCASCEKEKQYVEAEAFLLHSEPSDEALLDFIVSHKTRHLLASHLMELLFRKVYVSRRYLLPAVFNAIQLSTTLYLHFTRLFTQHSPSPLCSVFQYMIRKRMYWTSERMCCLQCIGNTILYSPANADMVGSWFMISSRLSNHVYSLIQANIYSLRGKRVLINTLYCILESSHLLFKDAILQGYLDTVKKISEITYTSLLHHVSEHPYGTKPLATTLSGFISGKEFMAYPFLKQRIASFKEELITKTWHPSRFVKWCLDVEEQEEFRQPDGSLYETSLYDY